MCAKPFQLHISTKIVTLYLCVQVLLEYSCVYKNVTLQLCVQRLLLQKNKLIYKCTLYINLIWDNIVTVVINRHDYAIAPEKVIGSSQHCHGGDNFLYHCQSSRQSSLQSYSSWLCQNPHDKVIALGTVKAPDKFIAPVNIKAWQTPSSLPLSELLTK